MNDDDMHEKRLRLLQNCFKMLCEALRNLSAAEKDRDRLRARVAALEAVAKYRPQHSNTCDATRPWGTDSDGEWLERGMPLGCSCGLNEAMRKARL